MKMCELILFTGIWLLGCAVVVIGQESNDPFLWLEEVDGPKALEWVKAHNAATVAELEREPEYPSLYTRILGVLNSRERIPYPGLAGEYVYNYWQDAQNPRGLWRRTLLADYLQPDPEWETVLDLDVLSRLPVSVHIDQMFWGDANPVD